MFIKVSTSCKLHLPHEWQWKSAVIYESNWMCVIENFILYSVHEYGSIIMLGHKLFFDLETKWQWLIIVHIRNSHRVRIKRKSMDTKWSMDTKGSITFREIQNSMLNILYIYISRSLYFHWLIPKNKSCILVKIQGTPFK